LKFSNPLDHTRSSDAEIQWDQFTAEPTTRTYNKKLEPGLEIGNRSFVSENGGGVKGGFGIEDGLRSLSFSKSKGLFDESSDEEEEVVMAGRSKDPLLHTISVNSASSDPYEVLRHLSQLFGRSVDYEMDFKMHRIQGVAYDKSARCKFVLRHVQAQGKSMGKHPSELEFTRRSGSQRLFSQMLKQIQAGLTSSSFFSDVTRPANDAQKLSGGSVQAWEGSCELDEASCAALVDMCASEFEDVQREALSSVATLVSSADTCTRVQAACGKKLNNVLESSCRSKDGDVRWSAAFIVARMCAVPEFAQSPLTLALVPLLFLFLSETPTMCNRGCKRQAALALQRLTSHPIQPALLASIYASLDVLEAHFNSPDPELQASIRLIVTQVSS